jgi:hypothetical protein
VKPLFILFLLFATTTCNPNTEEIDELNWRIVKLENRIDSLTLALTTPQRPQSKPNSIQEKTTIYKSSDTKQQSWYSSQCMATTRKGYRCSRKARSGGYCWQHGG